MIATTHESAVMDLSFVRQDEIWFIEREKNHQSIIYSLNKFNERFDKKIEKDYLLGRYGAIPSFQVKSDEYSSHKIVNMNTISEDNLNSELEKGYKDMIEGQTKPAKDAFDKNDYNI